jgi:hypothetical protein
VHRRCRWHPLAKEQLIHPELKHGAQLGGLGAGRATTQEIDPGLKQTSLTHAAERQLSGQAPIGGTQGAVLQRPVEGDVGIGATSHGLQGFPGEKARGQTGAIGRWGRRQGFGQQERNRLGPMAFKSATEKTARDSAGRNNTALDQPRKCRFACTNSQKLIKV